MKGKNEMETCWDDINISITEMLSTLNSTTSRVLDFKKKLIEMERSNDPEQIAAIRLSAEDLYLSMKIECKTLASLVNASEIVRDRSRYMFTKIC